MGDIYLVAGQQLCWKNTDKNLHSSTSKSRSNESWDSGLVAKGDSYCKVFNNPGIFPYGCSVHLTMVGNVIVTKHESEFPDNANRFLTNGDKTLGEIDPNNENEGYYSHIVLGLFSSKSTDSFSDAFNFNSMAPLLFPTYLGLLLVPVILFLS